MAATGARLTHVLYKGIGPVVRQSGPARIEEKKAPLASLQHYHLTC